jgi:hypothetical protein
MPTENFTRHRGGLPPSSGYPVSTHSQMRDRSPTVQSDYGAKVEVAPG